MVFRKERVFSNVHPFFMAITLHLIALFQVITLNSVAYLADICDINTQSGINNSN